MNASEDVEFQEACNSEFNGAYITHWIFLGMMNEWPFLPIHTDMCKCTGKAILKSNAYNKIY